MWRAVILFLLGAGGISWAQQTEPEVRRAIPIDHRTNAPTQSSDDYQNPSWVQQVRPTPAPTPRPSVGPEPGFTPYRPSGRVEVAATPVPESTPADNAPADESGDIRLSPANLSPEAAAAQALNIANGMYSRKMYDYAVTEYEKFLISYPSAAGRDGALFRLGESHRLLGNEAPARDAYQRLLQEFHQGEFVGAGAFRLGEYLYGDKLWDAALTQYQLAGSQAASPEVKLSATYQQARCLEKLDRMDEAIAKYREVMGVTKDNPYRNYARLSLAELSARAGQKKEALAEFAQLAGESSLSGDLRAQAAVKAASLAAETGDAKAASAYFDQALNMPDLGDWKTVAVIGALRTNYSMGNYQKTTTLAEKFTDSLPDEIKPEALLLTANSYRQLGNARAARAVYERLIFKFPNSDQAQDAGFQKLLSMYQLDDPQLVTEVDAFLQKSKDPKESAQASLLKAEMLFKNQKYADAQPIYAQIVVSNLDDDIKGKALMKLGWCFMKTGQNDKAVDTFTTYLQKFPQGASALAALTQRGLANQEQKKYAEALKDFDSIITDHPDAKERELALQQKALIFGQQQDNAKMTEVFQQMLKEYPKSPAAAQANFWIGWAAYENKDYQGAIPSLEAARKLDPAQYDTRAGLRIVLCYYYLQDRDALKRAISDNKKLEVPAEVMLWLGQKSFDEGDYASAEKYLRTVVKDGKSANPEASIQLAEALIAQDKADQAGPFADSYLQTAREPYSRARALLAQGAAALASHHADEAQKLGEQALLLQPEGKLNAQGRLLLGDVALASGSADEAAKAYMTVAVLYDDPSLTPRALEKAIIAYRKANNNLEADKAQSELQQRFPDYKKASKQKSNP